MGLYILNRFAQTLISILIASVIIFLIAEALPGDVAQTVLGQFATEESLEALRRKLGLNEPLPTRYLDWLTGILHGDLGTSLSRPGIEIGPLFLRRARNSAILALGALVFIIPLSLTLGVLAGLNPGTWIDRTISTVTLGLISFPSFITGLVLILIFSIGLGILPASSSIDPSQGILAQLPSLILPILALSGVMTGYIARHTRASFIKVMRADYIRSAVLKGLNRRRVIIKHVLRNALLPTVTVIALNLGYLLGGAIVVEVTFGYPGMARLVLSAIKHRDIPVMEAALLFVVAAYLVINFGTDILYTILDPKLRYGGQGER